MTKPQDPHADVQRSAERTKATHKAARDEIAQRNEQVSKEGRAKRRAAELARDQRRADFNQ